VVGDRLVAPGRQRDPNDIPENSTGLTKMMVNLVNEVLTLLTLRAMTMSKWRQSRRTTSMPRGPKMMMALNYFFH
jgi:hypothetical protein